MHWLVQAARDSLAEAVVINLVTLPVSFGFGYYYSVPTIAIFGFIVLLEATALMFIGGAMDLASSATATTVSKFLKLGPGEGPLPDEEKKRRFRRAVVFSLSGVFLFVEALALALPFT